MTTKDERSMIKVGFNVSYDWVLLKKSLPRIYAHADRICFSIDKNRKTWSGQSYAFDDHAFRDWLKQADPDNKVDVYEDDFSLPGLSAMENDSRQRNMMAARMGKGGWHVQIDSDEYFLAFDEFIKALRNIIPRPSGDEKALNVCPALLPLIKKVKTGYLFVDFKTRLPEHAPFATNVPVYHAARRNGHFNVVVPSYVIHETWARSDDELWYKFSNWGHADEEFAQMDRRTSYFNLWKSLDENNYQYLCDFHPGEPAAWPALGFCKAGSIEELMAHFPVPRYPLSGVKLFLRNSRNMARARSLFARLFS
ncbi:MAG TPA: hypothetical protein VGK59_04875 [Ohtaekwangia sp.]